MSRLALVKPSASLSAEIQAYRQEFFENGEESIPGGSGLHHFDDISAWIEWCRLMESRKTLPNPDLAEAEQFLLVCEGEGKILGMINFRHELRGEELLRFGGHIGYSVCPSERKQGYAKAQLRLCLDLALAFGLKRVLLTCVSANEGSRRTILACGGKYESTAYGEESHLYVDRFWITLAPCGASGPP
ncbi:MAG: GNAT family N-acetyltransferase [Christensenellaceae bacterium]|nr:GNAT family N-acetyltransferase [Christensenellaceae bacterium]